MKRRQLLVGLGLMPLATPLLPRPVNAQSKDVTKHEVEYLFVQYASEAKLANDVLTLRGVNSSTLYFSDRPDRIVGHVTTKKFIDHWAAGKDSFKDDPPNATLTILARNQPEGGRHCTQEPAFEGRKFGLRRQGPRWAENSRGRTMFAVHRHAWPAVDAAVDRRHASAHPPTPPLVDDECGALASR